MDVDDIKEFTWIDPLQKVIEERLNEPDYKTIWMTNTDVRDNGLLGMALCFTLVCIRLYTGIGITMKFWVKTNIWENGLTVLYTSLQIISSLFAMKLDFKGKKI